MSARVPTHSGNSFNQLILALDTGDLSQVRRLVRLLAPEVGMFKVGKQLFMRGGPEAVTTIRDLGGEVFLDLKFHDIPHTVACAAIEATRLGVRMFNVHASGGAEMMRQTAAEVERLCHRERLRRPTILAVTVLTSLNQNDLELLGVQRDLDGQVTHLARIAQDSGMDGVVCSAREALLVKRSCGPSFMVVTPGIRPAGANAADQKRVVTPAEAVRSGIDYIVVGRPISEAADPLSAARRIRREMNEAV